MLVSRRHIVFGSLALPALAAKKPAVERPNVVLILVDNLPGWMLACYGNKEVKSPNIQRLSDTGTRFLNHYAAAAVPEMNRATLLTGRTPMQIGDAAAPGAADVTFDKILSDAGYATHATAVPAEAQKFLDGQTAGKSFALTVSFGDLKPPYDTAPQKYLDMYAQERFESYAADPVAPNARAGKEMLLNRTASLRKVAATITAIDGQVGALLDKLTQKQLLDNSLVLFASTCGALYGRHGLWDAGQASDPVNMYDEVVQIPLIWSWPHRMPPQGLVIEMTSAYDLIPSLCDLLSLAVPGRNLCGRSYLPVAQQKKLPKKQPWRKAICAHTQNTDMAREEDYKVVLRDGGKGANELYDMTKDLVEKVNLYDAPEYLDVRTRLTADITRWKQTYSS
ncbi:MAG: sulfatase-like hydrolase/transferase [Candidatus Sulfopaludibacter sp.]|nr:sulfatase-like hydrolase/transferase [Candidatus Sulfopaludibacter sp.]